MVGFSWRGWFGCGGGCLVSILVPGDLVFLFCVVFYGLGVIYQSRLRLAS